MLSALIAYQLNQGVTSPIEPKEVKWSDVYKEVESSKEHQEVELDEQEEEEEYEEEEESEEGV